MSRTVIDVDDTLLAEAQRHYGTPTKVATVNAALEAAVKLARRRELAEAIAAGEFDFSDDGPGGAAR
ncbi:type II toxin-antitoxin system VapB family antitoxin [Yinghuangia soli]|uniref:Type II toxin-antitoxin system VapB family antitoxin n=1 Tax=Yinghuangia soli TaxID=2908204 RepID=A0AA41U088_9ACTN|nr:type II toxin-antitoxin system VapB family antitoxin [Yinghuangia soli]MCF2526187.1 type II toxin-antitoxin system VapB family antitoxin [Yinghuangia soli]